MTSRVPLVPPVPAMPPVPPGQPAPAMPPAAPTPIAPVVIRAWSTVSAAGLGRRALVQALRSGHACLKPLHELQAVCADLELPPAAAGEASGAVLPTWLGAVAALDAGADAGAGVGEGVGASAGLGAGVGAGVGASAGAESAWRLPPALAAWEARATRLAWLGLVADDFITSARAAVARHGAERVGLALGTSASTIAVSEAAYRHLAPDGCFAPRWRNERLNTPHALALFVAQALGIGGPSVTVSTACSSSAKVFAVAERWLRLGLVDAVVAGGVDALCRSVIYGFASLGLVSPAPCRPFDRRRSGISIGEAAGFVLLEREGGGGDQAGRDAENGAHTALRLLGHGEANDAHHMSSPHPEGLGAERALDAALVRAGVAGDAVDYVNLHGTASAKNDEVEAALFARRYGPRTLASATKGQTGHTMGAAGVLEAAICFAALEEALVPGTTGHEERDPALQAGGDARFVTAPKAAPSLRIAASHSFGFGGNNAVLIFGRAA